MESISIRKIWGYLCVVVLFPAVTAFLDLEELKNVHYEIDISDTPVLLGRPIHQEVIYLASKYGQRYECQLPDMTDYEKDQEEEKVASEVGISELLKPMEAAPCLIKTKDWWTYEFCYSRHIKQYHIEGGKQEDVKFLGHYESEMDWSNNTHKDAKRHKLNRYHSHNYINGTECDITGQPREAEVRFMCAEGHGDSIERIDEPSSCVYILTIHTTRICHHPFLRPPPSLKPKPVLCFPALEQHQYEHYTQIQEETIRQLKEKIKATQRVSVHDSSNDGDIEDTEDPDVKNDQEAEIEMEKINLNKGEEEHSGDIEDMMEAVLKTVKNAIKSIDEEISDTETVEAKTASKQLIEDEDQFDIDDEEDGEMEDEDLAISKQELEEYLNKPYTELMKEFREGIGEMTDDHAELARLNALAEQLESSFENLEAMDDVIDDVTGHVDTASKEDDEGTQHLVEILSKLIREVLNGPHLKEYMNTYGLYLSTLLEEFRDSIDTITDDPKEVKRLNRLADELEKTIMELKEDEQNDNKEEKSNVEETDNLASKDNFIETLKEIIKESKDSKSSATKKPKLPTSPTDDGKVRVRVTRIKLDKENKKTLKLDEEEELQVFDSNHRKIEESVQQHLDNAGVNIGGGGKVEVRILTYSPEEWPDGEDESDFTILNDDDSLYFKNMIVSLLGNDAEVKEQNRQNRLETNYHFTWDKETQGSTHEVRGQEVTEATEEAQDNDSI